MALDAILSKLCASPFGIPGGGISVKCENKVTCFNNITLDGLLNHLASGNRWPTPLISTYRKEETARCRATLRIRDGKRNVKIVKIGMEKCKEQHGQVQW